MLNHQISFLQKIKSTLPASISFVHELADLLEVSLDSAYRRLRGETDLTLSEILKICNFYKISPDNLQQSQPGLVTFQYRPLTDTVNFEEYWTDMLQILTRIRETNGSIIYAADDIPIFHHFAFPEHAAFKIFFWMRSFLNIKALHPKKFTIDEVPEFFIKTGKKIYETYQEINSIEIWTEESANSTLNQIAYYWESGLFAHREDALLVCEQLIEILNYLQEQATRCSKKDKENYKLYHSELQVGNNCVLVTTGDVQTAFVRHQTLTLMNTTNAGFCQETESFLKTLMQKSVLLSGVSEKQRHQFFDKIRQKTYKFMESIK
jgi:hypothetical protein